MVTAEELDKQKAFYMKLKDRVDIHNNPFYRTDFYKDRKLDDIRNEIMQSRGIDIDDVITSIANESMSSLDNKMFNKFKELSLLDKVDRDIANEIFLRYLIGAYCATSDSRVCKSMKQEIDKWLELRD